jgi:Trk K+ transport system NAD-binding subunit
MDLPHLRRYLKAVWRDTRVLVRQFRLSLLAFATLLIGGSLALHAYYVHPESGTRLGWIESLHAVFKLIFLETILPLPRALSLQLLFFAIPLIGLSVVADGVLRFGVALFNRRERKEAWQVAIASTYQNHIIVCGLGRIGFRVVQELTRRGEQVLGIESDAEDPFLDDIGQLGVPVLLGDARQEEMLEKACVRRASAIVACTADDLTNLAVALEAREFNPDIKVVLRMFDADLAARVQRGFQIHTAFSTTALAAPSFAAAATRAPIDQSFYVDEPQEMMVAMTTVEPGSLLEGCTITEVEEQVGLSIVLHKRQDALNRNPPSDLTLQAEDRLVVFASLDALTRLGEMCSRASESTQAGKKHRAQRSRLARLLSRMVGRG